MSTFHLNLLGFLYFVLFLIHTFAYYSFRSKYFVIISRVSATLITFVCILASDSPFDYLLKSPRFGKVNMRSFFCYCNIIGSSIALIFVMVLKIMLHMSGADKNAFDNDTNTVKIGQSGSESFKTMVRPRISPQNQLVHFTALFGQNVGN